MSEEESNSDDKPSASIAQTEPQKVQSLRSSPSTSLQFPGVMQQVPGRQSSPGATNPTPTARHSHARSKSVNLSPSIGASGISMSPGVLRWDDLASSSSNVAGPSSSPYNNALLAPAARIGSPHLRPSSPLQVNVQAASPSAIDFLKQSPGYNGSESGSSEGSSPDHRRRSSNFARAMERSSSGGSIGNALHLMSQSPKSPFRRTASPSRAYAVPLSPRLQAFGSHTHTHTRRLSGGNMSQLAGENLQRSTSPMNAKVDSDLPIDSIWPNNNLDGIAAPLSPRSEAIPIGLNKTQSTPIPPSLREDLLNNVNLFEGPYSPSSRLSSSASPQDHFHLAFADRRSPSPSLGSSSGSSSTGRREKRSSGSPAPYSPSAKSRPHSLPALAAPKPISRRAIFNLESSQSGHLRTSSDSSTGSLDGLSDNDDVIHPPKSDSSPAQKALSPPLGAQVKVDAQIATAEVSSGHNREDTSHDGDGQASAPGAVTENSVKDSKSSSAALMTSLDSTKAIASAHGIFWPSQQISPATSIITPAETQFVAPRKNSLTTLNGRANLAPDGSILRARSPALGSPHAEVNASLGDSPPKIRSFIGMPPRSGYDLSDDPDDVGSEDGSTGSGRESINEDRDDDDEDNDGDGAVSEEDEDSEIKEKLTRNEDTKENRPKFAPRRPSLGKSIVIYPSSINKEAIQALTRQQQLQQDLTEMTWKEGEQDGEKPISPHVKRTDLQMTRHEGSEEDEDSDEGNNDLQDTLPQLNQVEIMDASGDESLNTLERIFLFAKSEMTYHRILVSHSLSEWILEVELSEAVEFVIPLLNGLACDENEVCIAFAPHLHQVMWHFFRNCPLVEASSASTEGEQARSEGGNDKEEGGKEGEDDVEKATRPKISVGVFTPLLCALLLNYNANIASATQTSIVRFFAHLQGLDFTDADSLGHGNVPDEEQIPQQSLQFSSGKAQSKEAFDMNTALIHDAAAREEKRVALEEYDFGIKPRRMIVEELLHHVALAIGNLNFEQTTQARGMNSILSNEQDVDSDQGQDATKAQEQANEQEEVLKDNTADTIHHDDESNADSIMDDIPLTAGGEVETEVDRARDRENVGDTEMMEEDDQDHEQIGAASLDNISTVMSDVEEEVAVGRMASISLLAALGAEEVVSREFLTDYIVPEMLRFSSDHTFFVRKEVAVALGALAKCIGADLFQEANLMTIFESFCRDRIWHVRQAACLSMPNVFTQLADVTVKRTKVIEIMRIFVADVSRNVRVAALDIIGEMIYLFHQDQQGVPAELVRHFLGESYDLQSSTDATQDKDGNEETMDESSFSNSSFEDSAKSRMLHNDFENEAVSVWGTGLTRSISTSNANGPLGWNNGSSFNANSFQMPHHSNTFMDPDRPLVMAYNFPAIMLTLGSSHWFKLKPIHLQLCNNPSAKVRRSLAASLHEIAKIIGRDTATSDLLELFHRFLDSQTERDEQVKMAVLENLDEFLGQLELSKALECLQFLLSLWNEDSDGDASRFSSNWRLREKLITLIPALADKFLLQDDDGVLVVLMQSAIVDAVSSVRLQGVKVVSTLYRIFEESDQVLADGFLGMLVDVGDNESYRGRVACIHCLAELCKNQLQRSSVEMLMMNRLSVLSKDLVVDVRLALSQLISFMCSKAELYAMPKSRSEEFIQLLRRLCHDESSLVKEVVLSILPPEDPARTSIEEGEVENQHQTPRILILGPSGGGPHRLENSNLDQSFDDDVGQGVTHFGMDSDLDEGDLRDEVDLQGSSSFSPHSNENFSEKDDISRLATRDSIETGHQQSKYAYMTDADRDLSMIEDDEVGKISKGNKEQWKDHSTQSNWEKHPRVNGLHDNLNDEDDMIIIPSHDNFLMSSSSSQDPNGNSETFSTNQGDGSIGDDSFELEEPHHLLGVANDSFDRVTGKRAAESSPEHSRQYPPSMMSSAHSLFLESPERPWLQGSNDMNNKSGDIDASGKQESHQAGDDNDRREGNGLKRRGSGDPFLAFVADKRFDHTSGGEGEDATTL